jgi:hypothetical protein
MKNNTTPSTYTHSQKTHARNAPEFMASSSSVVCRTNHAKVPVSDSADVKAKPANPADTGTATPTASAVTNTTDAPVTSSRIDSHRLSSWIGHQARLDSRMFSCFGWLVFWGCCGCVEGC